MTFIWTNLGPFQTLLTKSPKSKWPKSFYLFCKIILNESRVLTEDNIEYFASIVVGVEGWRVGLGHKRSVVGFHWSSVKWFIISYNAADDYIRIQPRLPRSNTLIKIHKYPQLRNKMFNIKSCKFRPSLEVKLDWHWSSTLLEARQTYLSCLFPG